MKKTFIISILAGLLLPAFVFASYSRNPSGYTIYNPVEFLAEPVCGSSAYFWQMEIRNMGNENFYSGCYALGEIKSFQMNLPLGVYKRVTGLCKEDIDCLIGAGDYSFEQSENYQDPIFEVVETPVEAPSGGILTIPSNFIAGTMAYTQELFAGSGVWPLVALVIGLPLGFWFIKKVIDLKNEKAKKISLGKVEELKTKKDDWL
jgi:hypothetical protein